MFKKVVIYTAWLTGCYLAGFFGTKAFIKTAEWVAKKLNE